MPQVSPQPMATKYLGVLSDLRIVSERFGDRRKTLKSKKGLYRIADEFFRFWFRFVFPWRSEIEMAKVENVLNKIKEEMPNISPWV